jgi:hypothetical protein
MVQTAFGTILGGAIGFFLPLLSLGFAAIPGFLWGGLVGLTAAAIRLRLVTPNAPAGSIESGDSPV